MTKRGGARARTSAENGDSPVVVSINLGNFSSTGGIAYGVADVARAEGFRCYTAFPPVPENRKPYRENDILIGWYRMQVSLRSLNFRVGMNGCYAFVMTLRFLHKLRKLRPDILHLHNLHHSYINLPLLFGFIKRRDIPVVWTLHDCWTFTGHCAHFTLSGCEKWRTACFDCPCPKEYPACTHDTSKIMHKLKKRWFSGVRNMTLVTPSAWLAGLVRQSFLREYPVRVIHNGIDPSVFRPTASDFRKEHALAGRYLLLGVAFGWGERKGLNVFIELAKRLDARYQIALVGTSDETDKLLPQNIISIHRTQNREALAALYSAADLLVNPTLEENYPMVNMEALACGTPVITFDTGGSPEIPDDTCGRVVPWNDVDAMEAGIRDICENGLFTREACLTRAKTFDEKEKYRAYVSLYREILGMENAREGNA